MAENDNDDRQTQNIRYQAGDTPRVVTDPGFQPPLHPVQNQDLLHRYIALPTEGFAAGYLGTPIEMIDQAASLAQTGHPARGLSRQGIANTLMPFAQHYQPQSEFEHQLYQVPEWAGSAITPQPIGAVPEQIAATIERVPQVGGVQALRENVPMMAQRFFEGPTARSTLETHLTGAGTKIASEEALDQLKRSGVRLSPGQELALDAIGGGIGDYGYDVAKAGVSTGESALEAARELPRTFGRATTKDYISTGAKQLADPAEEAEAQATGSRIIDDEAMPSGHQVGGDTGDVAVKVNAEPESMLDWNKPYEAQSPQVQQQLAAMHPGQDLTGQSGGDIYKNQVIAQMQAGAGYSDAKDAASLAFHQNGIPGTVIGGQPGTVVFHPSSLQYSTGNYQLSPVDYQPQFANAQTQ